jgi:hypothetical protein
MQFTVSNPGSAEAEVEFAGWLQNPIGLNTRSHRDGILLNRLIRQPTFFAVECMAEDIPTNPNAERPDIVFDDFEGDLRPVAGPGQCIWRRPGGAVESQDYQAIWELLANAR